MEIREGNWDMCEKIGEGDGIMYVYCAKSDVIAKRLGVSLDVVLDYISTMQVRKPQTEKAQNQSTICGLLCFFRCNKLFFYTNLLYLEKVRNMITTKPAINR